jgi:5-methylcytosine-specific restriction endonuclease McrA
VSLQSNPERPVTHKHYRGASNSNTRGSSYERRRRKQWLLDEFGDGVTTTCYRCLIVLTFETITVDKIIPQVEGGTYRRSNIRPACGPSNSETGGRLTGTAKKIKKEETT